MTVKMAIFVSHKVILYIYSLFHCPSLFLYSSVFLFLRFQHSPSLPSYSNPSSVIHIKLYLYCIIICTAEIEKMAFELSQNEIGTQLQISVYFKCSGSILQYVPLRIWATIYYYAVFVLNCSSWNHCILRHL